MEIKVKNNGHSSVCLMRPSRPFRCDRTRRWVQSATRQDSTAEYKERRLRVSGKSALRWVATERPC